MSTAPDPQAETLPPKAAVLPGTIASLGPDAPTDTSKPTVEGYEILQELGRGGMGVVYLARQSRLNRLVALKMILAGAHAGADAIARFRIEAEAIARVQHPSIIQIFEIGDCDGKPFFSLEYCGGGSLAQQINGQPWTAERAAEFMQNLAEAMQAAHEQKILHRDLKPANVLFTADGTPKITDFGLAKKLDDDGHTATGTVMGTPSYMAPEQARGDGGELGPATDVYALGAILYELLTGRPPFRAAQPLETVLQVLNLEPVAPRRLAPQTPRDLETICLKCLHKAPRLRYASAQDLADDLQRFRKHEPILARPVGPLVRAMRWCRRHPVIAGLIVLVVLTLGLALLNMRMSLVRVETMARRQQVLLAESLARRLDQRLHADAAVVQFLGNDAGVKALVAAPPTQRDSLRRPVEQTLGNIVAAHEDLSSAFVVAANGDALASTNPKHAGRSFAFRDYVRQALQGKTVHSRILIGTSTYEPGMYVAAPVRTAPDTIAGAVVIKVDATAIWKVVDSLTEESGAKAWLLDEDGIVIAHRRRELLFHSMIPLDASATERVNPKDRFQREDIPSWNIPELAKLHERTETGIFSYRDPGEGKRYAASAPLRECPWHAVVDMDAHELGDSKRGMVLVPVLVGAVVLVLLGALVVWQRRRS